MGSSHPLSDILLALFSMLCSGSERIARRRSGQCETNEGITDRLAREAQRLMEQRMKKLLDIEQEVKD